MEHIGRHFQQRGFGSAVEVIDGAPFIGFIGLSVPSFDAPFMPCVERGYWLAFEQWRHGYATEGARAALAFGFATIGLPEIVASARQREESRRCDADVLRVMQHRCSHSRSRPTFIFEGALGRPIVRDQTTK